MTVPQMGFGGDGRRQKQQVLATVYEARMKTEQIGSWVLEFTVNGKQLDNSPFVMRVIPTQGCKDVGRVPDEVCLNESPASPAYLIAYPMRYVGMSQ